MDTDTDTDAIIAGRTKALAEDKRHAHRHTVMRSEW
jgi:hypothetical protein